MNATTDSAAPGGDGGGGSSALAAYDARPYFARALDFGLANGIIEPPTLDAIRTDGAKGVVQIANYFGTAHLRANLDDAIERMVTLASLYLEHTSEGNLTRAARSLQANTFLSHSRGGSEMLKRLFALPASPTVDEPPEEAEVKEFLRARTDASGRWSVPTYRTELAQRQAFQAQIEAALWFADQLEMPHDSLIGEAADHLLHAGLFTRVAGRTTGGLLDAAELKAFLKKVRSAKRKLRLNPAVLEDVPEQHRAVCEQHLKRLFATDLPRIADPKTPLDNLVREYHARFSAFARLQEIDDYAALVTDEWQTVTKGKTDTDSMNTVFLCIAAGLPPKPTIGAMEAKAAIRALCALPDLHDDNESLRRVPEFIYRNAPHQMIDGLIALWEEEFLPEVVQGLILESSELLVGNDGGGTLLDPTVRMLAQHCHIKLASRKG